MSRRARSAVLLALAAFLAVPARAAEAPYAKAPFEAAQRAGKPILVHVTAPWCTTCAAQKPILASLEAEPRFRDLQVFDVDFDSRKDVLRQFGVQKQSTLIVYRGGAETGRSTGETGAEALAALLDRAL